MATVNKHASHNSNNNSIVSEIVAWISGIISKARSEKAEEASNGYFECAEYEKKLIEKAAQEKINQVKYQVRRDF